MGAHALQLADQLKAQMYQHTLNASTQMDVCGATSLWLLAQSASRSRTIIEHFAPSVVPVTPQTDAGFFLAVVSMALISYLIFRLARCMARVTAFVLAVVSLALISYQRAHALQLADQLKAQMYQHTLNASTQMDVCGATSLWLLAQSAPSHNDVA